MADSSVDIALVEQITRRVIERIRQGSPQTAPQSSAPSGPCRIPVNISVRHVHVCQKDVDVLFGRGFQLEPRNELYQPGQYAAKQFLTLVGPRMRCLGEVRVLGPLRSSTQVEISKTDAIFLGVDPPVRPSGNHEGTPGIILVGPVGVVHLQKGVILANRHIHLSTKTAQQYGFTDNQTVKVRVRTHKQTVFEDAQLRIHESFVDEMHVDTDDGNAAGLSGGELVEVVT